MDFLCSQSYTRIQLCDFWLCSQHWLSSLHKGQHIFHSCMPSSRHTLDLRGIHTVCISHMGFPCSLACTCMLLYGSWHCIQHSGHIFQMCKGPSILYCSRLLWWGIHHQTCIQLCQKKKEGFRFCSYPRLNWKAAYVLHIFHGGFQQDQVYRRIWHDGFWPYSLPQSHRTV